jgi:hypothetical protein
MKYNAIRIPFALVLASLIAFGEIGGTNAFGDPLADETVSNTQRIEEIDQEAAPLAAELNNVQALIEQQNANPADPNDRGAVAAYNARSNQLNQQKASLIAQLKNLQDEQDRLAARNREIDQTIQSTVQEEQDSFDQMNEAWMRSQEQLIRESVERDADWRNAVLTALRNIEVPEPEHQPQSLDDLLPGDVLLYAPAKDVSEVIPPLDYFYRVASDLANGDIFLAAERRPAPVSHALTFVKEVNGVSLFLDHTSDGSRILDQRELARKYDDRKIYVARPQTVVDGRLLWSAAREAALRNKPFFGVLPGELVCSEQACVAISKATNLQLTNNRLGPVDVTPGDFFDSQAIGKYFIVSPLESGD